MKYFVTAATALLSLAAPSTANPVEKRTPGGVSHASNQTKSP
jgi:hypothetical protein